MNKPKLITSWEELKDCESESHTLEINLHCGCGWIQPKDKSVKHSERVKNGYYLSTHSFYGSNYKCSTEVLQKCGFNVELKNWDE